MAGVSGFLTFENIDMTEITRMQTIILVLEHPNNMHIKFLSISEVAAGKRHDFISN